MCGIVGYTGLSIAFPILINAMSRVEYRGYDSCGIAILDSGKIQVAKSVGIVEELERKTQPFSGTIGIGHTRWATVGEPNELNAHPHLDCANEIAIVHNGEIENFLALKRFLENRGHSFQSDTDSEVLVHLIEEHGYSDLVRSVASALKEVEGSFALTVLQKNSNKLVLARRNSPLVLGVGDKENFVASDVPALLEKTNQVIYLEDGDLGIVSPETVHLWHNELPVFRKKHQIDWPLADLDKAGYPHYMLKEIFEQPRVIRDILTGKINDTRRVVTLEEKLNGGELPEKVIFLGCGSAYHAALLGAHFFSEISDCIVSANVASEVDLRRSPRTKSWAVLLTQSGETIDTISAARSAKSAGYFTIGITNNPDSSITRIIDQIIYTGAGLEVSVASTKTFISQLIGIYLIGLNLFPPSQNVLHHLLGEIQLLPEKVQRVLGMTEEIKKVSRMLALYENVFFVGKGTSYPVALEGALKLKEIAYIHAEGYPAGELKHGPFALLNENTPVIAILPKDETYRRMFSTIKEIKARGAPVVVISNFEDSEVNQLVDYVLQLPSTEPLFSPVIQSVALQLLAYFCASERGFPIDRPRNLAKSVTVH